jgi:coenzyme F420-0:L-glutamate ligase / coenzyme F420-1:gamma-L-glutamate ligase
MITILPITGIGEIQPGDDLAGLLAGAMKGFAPLLDDVLVVTQKIVSKAENRFVVLSSVTPGPEAERLAALTRKDPRLVELVLSESTAVLRAVPNVLITRHRSGHVMANAGIDRSNTGLDHDDNVLLLPKDADASAAVLGANLRALGIPISAIVISDSFGRPWRLGVVNVAIGAVGFPSLVDRRGQLDRNGRKLEVTQIALADMAASAAGLVMGEGAESVPAALLRGFTITADPVPSAALVRPLGEDLFQ